MTELSCSGRHSPSTASAAGLVITLIATLMVVVTEPAAALGTRALFVSAGAVGPVADRSAMAVISADGFTVTVLDDDAFDIGDVTADVGVVVISTSVTPAKVGSFIRDLPVPVIVWEPLLYPKLGLTGSGASRGETAAQATVAVTDPAHPLAAALSGIVHVTTTARPFSFGRPGTQAAVIARAGAAPQDPVVFSYERGALLVGGGNAPARRVALFPSYATPPTLTTAGRSLLVAALRWATSSTPPPVNTPATIDVWHGDGLVVRSTGWGQIHANILGRLSDPDGVARATYALNGGPSVPLSIGPNQRRLVAPGDFNVDLPLGSIRPGLNEVQISVVDSLASVTTRLVAVTGVADGPVTMPYTADWSLVASPDQLATAVDGRWTVRPGTGRVELVNPGYDRILIVGDRAWTNYEVLVDLTVSSFATPGPLSGKPGVGVIVNWNGHNDSVTPGSQPLQGFRPLAGWQTPYGAIMWWRRDGLTITDHQLQTVAFSSQQLTVNAPLRLRAQVDRVGQSTVYRARLWPAGHVEPTTWEATWTSPGGPEESISGSLGLLAHEATASFGRVQVTPIP